VESKTPTILVSGTWGLNGGGWWLPGSDFCEEGRGQGVTFTPYPFIWSTAIDGVLGKNSEWTDAAGCLIAFVVLHKLHESPINIIAHSHGFSPVVYAATMGLHIDTLISVASPIRKEIVELLPIATKSIKTWRHIRGGRRDLMQILGELFDGRLGLYRDMPYAGNVRELSETHSGLLNPRLWTARRWWDPLICAPLASQKP